MIISSIIKCKQKRVPTLLAIQYTGYNENEILEFLGDKYDILRSFGFTKSNSELHIVYKDNLKNIIIIRKDNYIVRTYYDNIEIYYPNEFTGRYRELTDEELVMEK